jgi:hypothetical protein
VDTTLDIIWFIEEKLFERRKKAEQRVSSRQTVQQQEVSEEFCEIRAIIGGL